VGLLIIKTPTLPLPLQGEGILLVASTPPWRAGMLATAPVYNRSRVQQKGLDFEGAAGPAPKAVRKGLSVSELTERVRSLLETEMADVWVEGEVSNLTFAASGHWYFSLKDDKAQIRAVVWKNDARLLRFKPKDGLRILARGSLRVYAPKGEYQIQIQRLEPLGKGSLQQAFEELKERLEKEGLFAAERKRPLPLLPRRIGVVTSPTGAAIHDILKILASRYPNLGVLLYPAKVQGDEAADEIVQGIRALNRIPGLDVLILARGGGSLEDLWPFNEEKVARALAASRLPTISGVGHETDSTIADFVADHRAPTPSGAALRVVQAKEELEARIGRADERLTAALRLKLGRVRARVEAATAHRVFTAERGRIRSLAQRTDDLVHRAGLGLERRLALSRGELRRRSERLEAFRWDRLLGDRRERIGRALDRLEGRFRTETEARRAGLGRLAGLLESLSPLAVLARGYALVWDGAGRRLIRSPADVGVGEALRIRVHGGGLAATVTAKETP
jgi:exodeoxyribonuclease VII large subunit